MKFLKWLGRVIQAAKVLFPKKAKKVEEKVEEILKTEETEIPENREAQEGN